MLAYGYSATLGHSLAQKTLTRWLIARTRASMSLLGQRSLPDWPEEPDEQILSCIVDTHAHPTDYKRFLEQDAQYRAKTAEIALAKVGLGYMRARLSRFCAPTYVREVLILNSQRPSMRSARIFVSCAP